MGDFLGFSLPETSGMWLGLATQALLRNSTLALWGPRLLVTTWMVLLIQRAPHQAHGWGPVLRYGTTVLVVLALFWPETLLFGGGTMTDATRVISYPASQDPQAERVSADDTGLVPADQRGPVLVPWGMRFVLRGWQDLWLSLARTLNSETHRTFSNLLPMQWLLGTELTTDIRSATDDWVHNCYLPVMGGTLEMDQARTSLDFSPWGDGALAQALPTRAVRPGAQVSKDLSFITTPDSSNLVNCQVYLLSLEAVVQKGLVAAKTPSGASLAEVVQQELGMDMIAQSRFLLLQRMREASGPAVPPPSLLGQYLGLRAGSVAVGAGTGALTGKYLGGVGALVGALLGTAKGLSGELESLLAGVSWIVRIALIATWYAPYILGQIQFVVIGLLPLLVLLSLMFRQTGLILGSYILLLGFATSSPLWWAFVDQASKLAAGQPPQIGVGWDAAVMGALTNSAWIATITAIGIIVIPLVLSALLLGTGAYGAYRGISHLWRGGM